MTRRREVVSEPDVAVECDRVSISPSVHCRGERPCLAALPQSSSAVPSRLPPPAPRGSGHLHCSALRSLAHP